MKFARSELLGRRSGFYESLHKLARSGANLGSERGEGSLQRNGATGGGPMFSEFGFDSVQ
jgi:hypothetical protein